MYLHWKLKCCNNSNIENTVLIRNATMKDLKKYCVTSQDFGYKETKYEELEMDESHPKKKGKYKKLTVKVT